MSGPEAQNPQLLWARDYGAFDLNWLQMRMDVNPSDYLDPRDLALQSKDSGLDKKVELATAQAALFHETRHFHDTFGTRAGINLFLARFSLLQEFAYVAQALLDKGMFWVLPVTKASDMPVEAWRFLKHVHNVSVVCTRFQGQAPSLFTEEIPDPLPHVSRLREDALGTMLYAFPARAIRMYHDVKTPAIQHIPLGFDALLEGNAQVIQRNMVEDFWGQEVANRMFMLSGITLREHGKPAYAPSYNVTDLMVSRFMKNETGDGQFPRGALLALADHALTAAVMIEKDAQGERRVGFECAGQSFVDLLKETGPEAIRAGQIPPPLDEGYRQLRDYFAAQPSFESVDDTMSGLLADLEVVFRWLARMVIAPLLNLRLNTHHKLFSDWNLWLKHLPELPQVPFSIKSDGTAACSSPPRVMEAWVRLRMLERILAQLARGEPAILCPRAYRMAPGTEKVNYAHTGSCEEYLLADLCGRFHTGMPKSALPDCFFRDLIAGFGFIAPQRKPAVGDAGTS